MPRATSWHRSNLTGGTVTQVSIDMGLGYGLTIVSLHEKPFSGSALDGRCLQLVLHNLQIGNDAFTQTNDAQDSLIL